MASVRKLAPEGASRFQYGRADILEDRGWKWLRSYDTVVASVGKDGKVRRLWGGYSKSTTTHVLAFLRQEAPRPEGWTSRDFMSLPVSPVPEGLAFPERRRR